MDVSLRFLSVDRFSVLTVRLLLAHLFGLGWKDIDVTTSSGKRWPTTIMIVVWNPKDNITVKESAKKKEICLTFRTWNFHSVTENCCWRSAFLQERSRTWEDLEASWEHTCWQSVWHQASSWVGAPEKCLGGDGRTTKSEKKLMSNDPEI